jgi:hypothetical protein
MSRFFSDDPTPPSEQTNERFVVNSFAFSDDAPEAETGETPDDDASPEVDAPEGEEVETAETEPEAEAEGEDATEEEGDDEETPDWIKNNRRDAKEYAKVKKEWGELAEYQPQARALTEAVFDGTTADFLTRLHDLSKAKANEFVTDILAEEALAYLAAEHDLTPDALAKRLSFKVDEVKMSEDVELALAALPENLQEEIKQAYAATAEAKRLQAENDALRGDVKETRETSEKERADRLRTTIETNYETWLTGVTTELLGTTRQKAVPRIAASAHEALKSDPKMKEAFNAYAKALSGDDSEARVNFLAEKLRRLMGTHVTAVMDDLGMRAARPRDPEPAEQPKREQAKPRGSRRNIDIPARNAKRETPIWELPPEKRAAIYQKGIAARRKQMGRG